MSTVKPSATILVPTVEEVPRITDAERVELIASLDEATAQIAAGDFDVIGPDTLRTEFEAIMQDDADDQELDALLGIAPKPAR